MSRFPFTCVPIGWYQVAWSDELPAGALAPLRCFGRELVLYRGEDGGAARVLDAHCPHLGAHLGHGGRVEGGRLRCPFHGWCFDERGACVEVPYADKIPPGARVHAWPVREHGGLILVHHHPEGAPPANEPPPLAELGSPDWSASYTRRHWRVRTHVQEVAENLVDAAHFRHVHGVPTMPKNGVEVSGPVLRALTRLRQVTPRGEMDTTIEAAGHGLGLWTLRFRGICDTLLIAAQTPVDDDCIDIRFSFLMARAGGATAERGVGAAMIAEISRQTEEDIPIWEHKIYRREAALCAADGPLIALRRWARQFYL